MSDRRVQRRLTFEEKYRALENVLKQKCHSIHSPRDEFIDHNRQNGFSPVLIDQAFTPTRSNANSYRTTLNKNREIARLKALIYQKDNELLALATTHRNALSQIEERIERERKVWNEHKELILADERAKFEEEKGLVVKDLQSQLNLERERCEHLEKKLYDAQMQSSEAQFQLKESDRERINAIYGIKEQCRKEYQDEIIRLRNQFQSEKDVELTRIQDRIRELEQTVNHLSNERAVLSARRRQLLLSMDAAEKTCVRAISDIIKKLLLAMNCPSHVYSSIPNMSSFIYDETALIARTPTRSLLVHLLKTVDEIRDHVVDQRVQLESKPTHLRKRQVPVEKVTRASDDSSQDQTHSYSKSIKVKSERCDGTGMSKDLQENDFQHSCHTYARQSHTVDNLLQKLEDHIATELTRLAKQRAAATHPIEIPEQIKPEFNTDSDDNQDALIRHLQNRMNDLRNDNIRLRESQLSSSSTRS